MTSDPLAAGRREVVPAGPRAVESLCSGIRALTAALAPTLGPGGGIAAIAPADASESVELLDDGALIARRIIALDGDEDIGAMLLRHMLWRLRTRVGDGSTTAALLCAEIVERAARYLAAGGSPDRMRAGLEVGASAVDAHLGALARPLSEPDEIERLATSLVGDESLGRAVGDAFATLGAYGRIDIVAGRRRTIEREYVSGSCWRGGLHPGQPHAGPGAVRLKDAAVLMSDLAVDDPRAVVEAVRAAADLDCRGLVIVCSSLEPDAAALLARASADRERFTAVAVRTPGGASHEAAKDLDDLRVCAGGQMLLSAAGASLESVRPSDLGRVTACWASDRTFAIETGDDEQADRRRQRLLDLHQALQAADGEDARDRLRERIGVLMGASAVIRVGSDTDSQRRQRLEAARRACRAVRCALEGGVFSGAGAALLSGQTALADVERRASGDDERMACRVLGRALEMPARVIAGSVGADEGQILAAMRRGAPSAVFDVRTGEVVDAWRAGILDPAPVLRAALRHAVETAGLALTAGALVRPRRRGVSLQP